MTHLPKWIPVLGAACLLGAASGGGASPQNVAGVRDSVPRGVSLEVDNQNFYDATVYAVSDAGERQRLGRVTGLSHDTFTFRWLHQELRVLIQLLADGSAITQPVLVNPGDSLNMVIQPDLNLRIPD